MARCLASLPGCSLLPLHDTLCILTRYWLTFLWQDRRFNINIEISKQKSEGECLEGKLGPATTEILSEPAMLLASLQEIHLKLLMIKLALVQVRASFMSPLIVEFSPTDCQKSLCARAIIACPWGCAFKCFKPGATAFLTDVCQILKQSACRWSARLYSNNAHNSAFYCAWLLNVMFSFVGKSTEYLIVSGINEGLLSYSFQCCNHVCAMVWRVFSGCAKFTTNAL